MPDQETQSETINWYDARAAKHAATLGLDEPVLYQVDEFLANIIKGGVILDIGGGAGSYTQHFSEKGYKAIDLDLSNKMLTEAQTRYPDLPLVRSKLEAVPIQSNVADGIWCHAALQHIPPEEAKDVIKEFSRVLKPNGIVHLFTKEQTGSDSKTVETDEQSGFSRTTYLYTLPQMRELFTE